LLREITAVPEEPVNLHENEMEIRKMYTCKTIYLPGDPFTPFITGRKIVLGSMCINAGDDAA